MAKAKVNRGVAPKVVANNLFVDKRMATTQQAEAAFPGFTCMWKRPDVTTEELETNGLEIVHWKDINPSSKVGDRPVKHRKDILCRKPLKDWQEQERLPGEEFSRNLVQQSMTDERNEDRAQWQLQTQVHKPKRPEDINAPIT